MQTIYQPERTTFLDPDTKATVIQWTSAEVKNQHLYFTSPSVTADGRWLVFISERDGQPNLFTANRANGEIRRVSDNRRGLLRSYVYPQGGLQGLSKASPCLDANHNRIFYIQDQTVYAVDLDDECRVPRAVWQLPENWYSAFNHVSPDGRTLCVPCTDPRAFLDKADTQWEQMDKVPLRMGEQGLKSRIYLIDIASGTSRLAAEVPFWVTHVQFDPAGSGRIVFNLEGFGPDRKPLPGRIWCLDANGEVRPLAAEELGEWRTHENWSPDGKCIIYHGNKNNSNFLAARSWDGQLLWSVDMAGISVYHATGALDGKSLFADQPDGFISKINPFVTGEKITHLCRHDTSIADQDAHAHPLITGDGKSLVFTSNKSGQCQVYEVILP